LKINKEPHDSPAANVLDWQRLSLTWQSNQDALQLGVPRNLLAPTWQVLLLGDGSTTRHLQLLTGEQISVDVIDMSPVGMGMDHAPELIQSVPGPRLRRQVWLKDASGNRLAYAVSWWEASHVDEYLCNRKLPIWASLADLRMELYRDIRDVSLGDSKFLAAAFGYDGPFWGRYYLFWHDGKPLTLIYEVFSPYLELYLGSARPLLSSEDSYDSILIGS
jgi:chorismate lyase